MNEIRLYSTEITREPKSSGTSGKGMEQYEDFLKK